MPNQNWDIASRWAGNIALSAVELSIITLVIVVMVIWLYNHYAQAYRRSDDRITNLTQPLFNKDPQNMLAPRCTVNQNYPDATCTTDPICLTVCDPTMATQGKCIPAPNPMRKWDKCDTNSVLHYDDGTVAVSYDCEPVGWKDGDTKDTVVQRYSVMVAPTGWDAMCQLNDYNCVTV